MKITVDSWAWINNSDLSEDSKAWLKKNLTLTQRVSREYAKRSTPAILHLWKDDAENDRIGIPREFFFENMTRGHEIEYRTTSGQPWPARTAPEPLEDGSMPAWASHRIGDDSDLTFFDTEKGNPVILKPDQLSAVETVVAHFSGKEASGGLIEAPTGFGKTVLMLDLIRKSKLKTAVLVHREFLLNQWKKAIARFLPDARVGIISGSKWKNVDDAHIVLVMIETLASWSKNNKAPAELSELFGLIGLDEVHRGAAPAWGAATPMFNARYRVGVSANPTRSDGLEKVLHYHIGRKLFTGTTLSRIPKIRRVWTDYKINHPRLNSGMLSMEFVFKLMSANKEYNAAIVDQAMAALNAGRKVLIFSHTVKHLNILKAEIDSKIADSSIKTDYYIGGMTESDLEESAKADCILGTFQMCKDSLDIPRIDTVILAGPIRNPQQSAGRACRDHPDKKDPIVVDIRSDNVPILREYGESRDRVYAKIYNEKASQPKLAI